MGTFETSAIGFGLMGMGLIATLWGLRLQHQHWRFRREADQAVGVVVGHQRTKSRNSLGWEYPVVEFTTPDGRTWSFRDINAANPRDYPPGRSLRVAFDRSDPADARIDNSVVVEAVVMIGGGAGFVAVTSFLTYYLLLVGPGINLLWLPFLGIALAGAAGIGLAALSTKPRR